MAKRRTSPKPTRRRSRTPAPKSGGSKLVPHPAPRDPAHEEWRIDEADDESFPASDPSAAAQPHRPKRKRAGP
jgi:hypothetical protein